MFLCIAAMLLYTAVVNMPICGLCLLNDLCIVVLSIYIVTANTFRSRMFIIFTQAHSAKLPDRHAQCMKAANIR